MEKRQPLTPVFDVRFMPEEMKERTCLPALPQVKNALELGEYICRNRDSIPQDLIKLTEEKNTLEELNLKHLRLNPQCIQHLSVILCFLKQILIADFSDMLLDPSKIQIIAAPLKQFSQLLELHLTGNEIRSGCKFLSESLKGMQSLELLNLNDCSIGPSDMKFLSPGLKSLKSIKILQLSLNPISDAGCEALCEVLPEIPSLLCLELFTCLITNVGGKMLFKVFQKVQFESVLLGNNKFSPSFENQLKKKFRFVHVGVRHNKCEIF
jgi:Ran GTPase-activating protein (RanGAP) involved in mRNA processing and transport